MKKILLGTTTLVGAVLVSQAALADAPKVTLGGTSDFQAGFVSDDIANQRNHGFKNDNEISVKVDGKSDMGLGYGAEIWLEADVTDDADLQGTNASKTFLYVDGAWGRLEGGSTLGPDQTLKIGAESIARATGGIDGDWYYYTTNAANHYIATPDLPLNYGGPDGAVAFGDESEENATKVVYYTPKWNGLQAGVAYVPTEDGSGQTLSLADNTANTSENIWVAAVNYSGQFEGVTVGLAATGNWGDAETAAAEDLSAWQVGGKLGYMGFAAAASYGEWNDSNVAAGLDDSDFWTAGLAYETGPWGVSVTYLDSTYEVGAGDNDFTSWSVGADYKLAPGLTPYVEFTDFDADPAAGAANDGHVFLVGSSLNF
jgi:hypothetical protein